MRNDGRDDRRGNYVPGIISSHEIRERGYRVGTPSYCVVEEGYLVISARLVAMYCNFIFRFKKLLSLKVK